jgi:hypothetical protein
MRSDKYNLDFDIFQGQVFHQIQFFKGHVSFEKNFLVSSVEVFLRNETLPEMYKFLS